MSKHNPIAKYAPKFNKPKIIPPKKGKGARVSRMKTFSKFMEDAGGLGAGAPTTATGGLGSVVDKSGNVQSPPVFRKKKTPVMGMVTRKMDV